MRISKRCWALKAIIAVGLLSFLTACSTNPKVIAAKGVDQVDISQELPAPGNRMKARALPKVGLKEDPRYSAKVHRDELRVCYANTRHDRRWYLAIRSSLLPKLKPKEKPDKSPSILQRLRGSFSS